MRGWLNAIQMHHSMAIFYILCLLGCLACSGTKNCDKTDPEDVLKGFLQDLDAQDYDSVWACLSQTSQNALRSKARAFNQNHPENPRLPQDLLRAGHVVSSTREYKKFETLSLNGQCATVAIVMQNNLPTIKTTLCLENDHWKISLPLDSNNHP